MVDMLGNTLLNKKKSQKISVVMQMQAVKKKTKNRKKHLAVKLNESIRTKDILHRNK